MNRRWSDPLYRPPWLYELADPLDPWFSADKFVRLCLAGWIASETDVGIAIIVVVLVEVVRVVGWQMLTETQRLLIDDAKLPQPLLAGRTTLKGLVASAVGILTHLALGGLKP